MVAIYTRQSIEKKDSLSIQGQIDLCARQLTEEYKVYRDSGYSGKNTRRPAFQRLLQDIEKGLITKVYVYRLDRFSRSIMDFGQVWEFLRANRVEFVSVTEQFDTSAPMGRAMLQIIMVFAQLERETTAERVKDNYYQRAALGSWPGGPAPYGFSIGRTPDGNGHAVPALRKNEFAPTVERIFLRYAQEDVSLGLLARELTAEHSPPPRRDVWDNVTLSRLLRSPLYVMADEDIYLYFQGKGLRFSNDVRDFDGSHAGMVIGKRSRSANKYNDLEEQHFSLANHSGFISSELWLHCQWKLDHNRQLSRANQGKHSWLTGLMKCAACGYSVKVNRDGERFYLICSRRSNQSACGQSIQVDLRALEHGIEQELCRLLEDCPPETAEKPPDGARAEQLAKIERKIQRLIHALSEGSDVTIRYINRQIERLEQEKNQLIDAGAAGRQAVSPGSEQIRFCELTMPQKKLVAARFIERVELAGEQATVKWRV
ncbi:MAG: hin 2 [Oscillospiraceae bacterium]|nr:hin 2 [Oscillospiraceae bacterium]